MIANFFNKSKPVNMIYILAMLFVYFLIHCFIIYTNESITSFFLKNSGLLLINIWILFLINFIISKNKLIHNNYFPLLIVVLLSGALPETMFKSNLILSNLFLLLAFRKIFSLKSQTNTKAKIFDGGFWIGIATLFYSWSILFIFLIYVSIIIYKKVSFKNVCIPIIGFITPIFIYFTYLFYFDDLTVFYNQFNFNYSFQFEPYRSLKTLIPLLFSALILIWAIINVTPKYLLINNTSVYFWHRICRIPIK